jgi:hypothetical protein
MKPTLIAFALAAALSASAAHAVSATNLLVNGGFELPAGTGYAALPGNSTFITGWTTVATGVEWFNASAYGGAADGVMVVDLANYTYASGGIEQSFATVAGATYDLAFNLGTMQSSGRDGTAHIDVTVAGITTGYNVVNHSSSTVWAAPIALSFTANSTTTTLRFTNTENAYFHFAYVDGVSVTAAVPEPETYALMLAGLGLVGFVARRRAI